ncbi:uncharacterized protein LOC118426383 [Branchiostoma floridae]|uniref:Uncharacterized protein LOC118426383 n=1 Tax=Branchiostoma floridae TaxID=7739 RepID=A0A9J7M1Y6_BRAFL|nr:uncharacterized protein LOC118426383 [Branchiostoma floridae]XP_035691630.1 uncharacterized protein LOC118426383 [Branchiostoma floridae]XP_035691631.1 uncharacterized protein LOC118426383 [Branchiostoma floridae]XP_035691632.1 uncharacterized protein LOC118426383 [Branchiostoma floridae]
MEANDVERTNVTSSLKAARGILLTLMSSISISFCAEFMANKDGIPSFQILFLMRLTELLALVPILAFCRPRLTGKNRRENIMLFIFVIVSNAANILHFLSFTYTVPGISFGIIQGSMPFFVACIGFLVLKESLGIPDVCAILISVTGVVLLSVGMTQVGTSSTKLLVLSIVIPVLASLVFAPDMVIMRYLTGTLGVPIVTALLYQTLFGTAVLLAITYSVETPVWTMATRTALYVVGVGVSKFVANFTILSALKVVKAYISTSVRMFAIPFSLLLDYLLMQKVPNSLQAAGVVLVMLGIVLISVYTWWSHRRVDLQRTLLKELQFDTNEK